MVGHRPASVQGPWAREGCPPPACHLSGLSRAGQATEDAGVPQCDPVGQGSSPLARSSAVMPPVAHCFHLICHQVSLIESFPGLIPDPRPQCLLGTAQVGFRSACLVSVGSPGALSPWCLLAQAPAWLPSGQLPTRPSLRSCLAALWSCHGNPLFMAWLPPWSVLCRCACSPPVPTAGASASPSFQLSSRPSPAREPPLLCQRLAVAQGRAAA